MSLILDLSTPGTDPAALVAAARSVGAQGVAGYLRNWPEWTPAMAQAVLEAGLAFLPIELYDGQAPTDTLAKLAAWSLPLGPVANDVETGSWPSDAWQLQWQQAIDGAGYASVGYSRAAASVPYQRRWRAQYTWPGQPDQMTLLPVQPIPAGVDAVQYAHDFVIGGLTFDASNFSFALMTADPREDVVKAIYWNRLQSFFRVKPDGTLVHAFGTPWQQEALGIDTTYVASTLEVTDQMNQGQLDVLVMRQNGSVAHFWQECGGGTWSTEDIPA